jgi:predicted nucleotidyltransferase
MGVAEARHDFSFEELCEIVAPIAEKRGVERIYLFGSRVRGDSNDKRDYDFYIMPGRIRSLMELCGLLNDLEEALGNKVDIVTEGSRFAEDFKQEIFRERRLVYGT